jgi:hypothetical protein
MARFFGEKKRQRFYTMAKFAKIQYKKYRELERLFEKLKHKKRNPKMHEK